MKGFSKTRTPNMARNDDSGMFYAVARAPGKAYPVYKSLKTDVESVAKARLPGKLAKIRAGTDAGGAMAANKDLAGLGLFAELYLENIRTKPDRHGKMRQPRSIAYREETVAMLRRAWPKFDRITPAAVSPQTCNDIMANVLHQLQNRAGRKGSFATRYNGALQTLRGILEVAVDSNVIPANPTRKLKQISVPPKERHPPSRSLLGEIFMKLDGHPRRRDAAKSVRALAFTGLRANEARHLTPSDVTLTKVKHGKAEVWSGTLLARVTKNGKPRTIILIPQAVDLFREDLKGTIAALKKSPRRALRTICRELKIDRLTPHDFRVLFSTRMDEAGVTMKIGAETLGHQDEGQVRRKHYIHHAPEYVRRQMEKVVV